MKGRYWDYEKNEPMDKLKEFLDNKVISVKNRIKEATGVDIEPIYYSAGFKEEGEEQSRPYNLSKLLYYIVKATPTEKRAVYVNNTNEDENMWRDNDDLLDYGEETRKSIMDSVVEGASRGVDVGGDIGGEIGGIFGKTGERIGRAVGSVVGGVIGAVGGFIGGFFS